MPRVCFSTGCNTGYVKQRREAIKDGKKVPSLFQAPRDIGLLDKWKRSIPRSDRELTSKDFVCALHFKTSEIETHYEVKLADGSIWKTERDRPLLKKDAVPSIFPNLPHYLSDSTSVRKPPSKRARLETLPVNLVRISSVTGNFTFCLTCSGYLQGTYRARKTGVCKECLTIQKKKMTERLQSVVAARKQCALSPKDAFHKAMENLPEGQREAISACLRAAKSPSTGMRYTSQWIYECLLLKIKSTKAYNHLRSHQLLKLPSPATLYRYLKNVKGCYGFQSSIFKCLEGKSKVMTMANKRGK
nr:uncharacterized protein LOC122271819 [Parasteatoda tepidariorum]